MYLELAKDSTQMRTARGGQGVVSWLGCAEDPRPERPLFSRSSTPHLPWRTARRDAEFLSSFSRPTESRLKLSGTPEQPPSPQFVSRGQLWLLLLYCPQAWFLASKGVKYVLPHGLSCLYHPEEGLRVDSKVPPSNTGHIC